MAIALMAAPGARAAFLSINDALPGTDNPPNENIQIDANDFEGGLFINGNLSQVGLGEALSRIMRTRPCGASASNCLRMSDSFRS